MNCGKLIDDPQNVQKQVERIIAEYEDTSFSRPKSPLEKSGTGEEDQPRTVFHVVLDSSLPPSEKTVNRITDEAFVMIVAGGETTARTLTNALYHLLANPDWKDLVIKEIDTVMPDPNILCNCAQLEQLPVLTAAIKETLRVSTPVTNRVQVLDPAHELNYRQWTIPKGTPIGMSVPGIHLDASIFRDPYTFNPGRFLGEQGKLASKYYMPFHRGYRSCLGMK